MASSPPAAACQPAGNWVPFHLPLLLPPPPLVQDASGAELIERMRATQAASKVRELSPAEAFKEDGNTAFKRGNWEAAVAAYTK
jgi:hypothetical protein